MNTILIPVSIGELADKLTILEIKAERIEDAGKRAHVQVELEGLRALWAPLESAQEALAPLKRDLRAINERMWDVQDALRAKEAAQAFDGEFVTLARAVAQRNGERIAVKNTINRLAGSRFIEEKQYQA
ncbi:DUF6165 family protein [Pseudoxanthomonas japonensis]|jgi:hypothetical protein|uniref:Uncharacterized protein n=1 Tax=Pseudoxanthomonas japonensis TaxID=69284 RepID=A0ABQ6ZHR1_9GAMM|nr:DUF6165 family protein [Pseudoxanthomonas japonensis]KAF1725477.1 hypothetical protein CSC78_08405 [Pseudoxanthomonas japonensis]MCR6624912.1 DUF6165 family protein [Pseudoxanthomonas sp.]PZQ32699.1 MAG: hypothetical protein DI562_03035 [Stenotrophomonas acidaminiphila]